MQNIFVFVPKLYIILNRKEQNLNQPKRGKHHGYIQF